MFKRSMATRGLALSCALFSSATIAAEPPQVLDDCSHASRWQVIASDGVKLECHEAPATQPNDEHGTALKLDFNFVTGGGYAGIRLPRKLDLPPNFELAFTLRGELPRNNLEFKLVDDTGNNVWWVNRRAFEFPKSWTRLASRRRHLQFAWGPSNTPIQQVSAIEIVVSSVEGGRGSLYLDDLTFRPLPETKPYAGTLTASASSSARGSEPRCAVDGKKDTEWLSTRDDKRPQLTVDFGGVREFGGLVVDWDPVAPVDRCNIQTSDDGKTWTTIRSVDTYSGFTQYISLPDSEARYVRFACEPVANFGIGIRELEVLPLEASRDSNTFAAMIAARAPRGHYPRAFHDEGVFWTIVGSADDSREALVSEDGAVEVDKQAFSIEPFLFVDHGLQTWAEAKTTQSLVEGFVPVPTVVREQDGIQLSVTAAADGKHDDSSLLLQYQVMNTNAKPARGKLLLAIRPFQVNPPYQWLNAAGGTAKVGHIAFDPSQRSIQVDDRLVALGVKPNDFGCAAFDAGDITEFIDLGSMPPWHDVNDPQHAASAAAAYDFDLPPGKSRTWVVCVPFSNVAAKQAAVAKPLLTAADPVAFVEERRQVIVNEWKAAVSTFDLLVPPAANDIVNTIHSTLAYILINRDNVSIQPGSRSYERSWIRDGSLTATALMRFGLAREARDFVNWYAPYQFESGKIPCVVDRRGPDPVPENDSHGQFIMAVMNEYRFTGDKEFLKKHWPRVQKAVGYIEELRSQRMTAKYADPQTKETSQEPNKPAVSLHASYGLMPESISHEGYSAKPMHSYWDDFFTLRGLKDATEIARVVGDDSTAKRYQSLAEDFAKTLYASIHMAMQTHKIDYIPGCVELGDFDATSTTVALWPGGEIGRLPRPALDHTFDRYWKNFVRRRDDPTFQWADYTPYEWRCVGTLIQLGHPDRGLEAIEFFMHDRRPVAWNQWPEIVYRKPRTAKFLGDLPHTWCGSDFLNSVRMMFLFEREVDDGTVLLAGIPQAWISTRPVGFRNMPTYGGRLTCTIACDAAAKNHYAAHLEGKCPVPTGGFRLTVPNSTKAFQANVNGQAGELDADKRVIIRQLPADIAIESNTAAN